MATRLAIAFDPAVLSTAPTSVNLVHGLRKRSGPVGIPCIPGHGSHASAPAPSATVSLANRGGSASSENPVNGTPTSSVVLTQNGDKDGARESRASPPPTDRLRTRSHASACKITQALAGEDLLPHKPRRLYGFESSITCRDGRVAPELWCRLRSSDKDRLIGRAPLFRPPLDLAEIRASAEPEGRTLPPHRCSGRTPRDSAALPRTPWSGRSWTYHLNK